MSTAIRAENASLVSQSTTEKTCMRVTAVRPCRVYFRIDGYGIDPAGNKVDIAVYRGRANGTAGSAITPTKLDSTDADTVTDLATFLDEFSVVSSGGTKVDHLSVHPQSNGFSLSHKLNAAETLDITADVYSSGTVPLRVQAIVRDLV